MSYAVVRVRKMTRGAIKGIEIHDRRESFPRRCGGDPTQDAANDTADRFSPQVRG